MRRTIALRITAVVFVAAGVMHFIKPQAYARIVPPGFPSPAALVAVSGLAEIAGGLGLLVAKLRRSAGWGLIALLAGVFPANLYMALRPDRFADLRIPAWVLWARLPLQPVLMLWVAWVANLVRRRSP